MPIDVDALKAAQPHAGMPFRLQKIGHIVLRSRDMARTVKFYTEVLGFKISDVYGDDMVPGGMVFMRLSPDHHGVAFVGGATDADTKRELDHLAFEVATLDEVVRAREHLKRHNVRIVFDGRRRAGVQIAVEFLDPDDHHLEIYWGLDQIGSDGLVRPREQWKGAKSLEEAITNPVIGQDTTLQDPVLRAQLKIPTQI
jgi:catechol 2,3-dioxygenase-like lactoylglutathione lyase family enzyme